MPCPGVPGAGGVNSTGISLIPLIDFFSHQPGQHSSWVLDYDSFTLDQLKHTRD